MGNHATPYNNDLLTEIAIAYYQEEMTQEKIAEKFNISRIKVGRLLKQAKKEGIVEINVRYHPIFSSRLEKELIEHFHLKRALIALDAPDEEEQRRLVGAQALNYLASILKDNMTVAVSQGRNLAAVANHIASVPSKRSHFVSSIGGTDIYDQIINADHISQQLAKKFGGTSQTLYAPSHAETLELKNAFMQSSMVKETLEQARKADIALVGIGEMSESNYMVTMGWTSTQEIYDASINYGITGEIAGYGFFNAQGKLINTTMNDHVIGLTIDELRQIPCVIAIASESTKALAIMGALRSGAIDVIATSAKNAKMLLNMVHQ